MRARLLALIFISALSAVQADEKPDEASCKALYLKRIADLAAGSDLAAPGIRLRRPELESEPAVNAAVENCRNTQTIAQVRCALDASACQDTRQPDQTETPEEPPRDNPPATASECRNVYDHLLSIYATDELLKKPGGEQLLLNWKSAVARQSFQARCEKVFHKQDSECILSSKDPDIARACLLVIPE